MKNWQSAWANSKEAYVPDWCRKYDVCRGRALYFKGLVGGARVAETDLKPGCHRGVMCPGGCVMRGRAQPGAEQRFARILSETGYQAPLAQTRCRHRLACPPGETAPCRRRQYTKSRSISAGAFHSGVAVVVLAFVAAVTLDVDLTAAAVGAEEIAGAHERARLFGDDPEPQIDQLR